MEAALAITLLAPMIPMLFMGEEWGSTAPFPFFCDFQGDLADAVRKGRRKEFAGAYAKYGDEVPDPLDEATFRSAVLDWNARDLPKAHRRLTLVRELLSIRRREIVPRLAGARFGEASAEDNGLLTAKWKHGRRRGAAAAGQSFRPRNRRQQTARNRNENLGRRLIRRHCAMDGLLGTSDRADAPCHSDRDLSRATDRRFQLRRRSGHRSLPESTGHHASLCVALHEGAQGQHPRLRHRRSHRDQSRTGRRCRVRTIERRR